MATLPFASRWFVEPFNNRYFSFLNCRLCAFCVCMMSDCRGFVLKNVLKFVDFWCPKKIFVEWEACCRIQSDSKKTQMVGTCAEKWSVTARNRWRKIKGKICCRRKRLHMLSDVTSSAEYLEVKRAAEVCEGWRIGELPKLCVKIRPDSWLVCGPFRSHLEWRHEWQHGGLCAFRHSFGCVLLLDQIFRKQCTVQQYTTLIYLINLLGKLVLGLWLDSELHYFSIFTENKKNEHLIK